MSTIHIVLSVFNGERYIRDQIRSVQDQSHEDWLLWIRDDGSTDGTGARIEELAHGDERIRLLPRDGRQRGVAGGFSWLLESLPEDAEYVACCDADDVWLPEKLERSMEGLQRAEAESATAGPEAVLLHTDLSVTDARLNLLSPSFWRHVGMKPEPVTLRRLLVENVATGPTLLFNRPLLERVLPIPPEVPHHDWWIALVAGLFGRVVALPEATVLYRRHDGNHTGGFGGGSGGAAGRFRRVVGALGRTADRRKWLAAGAHQARLLLERFGEELDPEDRELLAAYAEIPRLGVISRKLRVLRLRALPAHGLARNLALLLRA